MQRFLLIWTVPKILSKREGLWKISCPIINPKELRLEKRQKRATRLKVFQKVNSKFLTQFRISKKRYQSTAMVAYRQSRNLKSFLSSSLRSSSVGFLRSQVKNSSKKGSTVQAMKATDHAWFWRAKIPYNNSTGRMRQGKAELMSPSFPKNCIRFAGRECSKKLTREFIIKCDICEKRYVLRQEAYDFRPKSLEKTWEKKMSGNKEETCSV